MLKHSLKIRKILNTPKYSTEAIQKETYYKNLAALQEEDSKPSGWYEAQPFENIPGPKALPIIGNVWRFLPGGEFYNVQLDRMIEGFPKKYGKIVKLDKIFGRQDMVFLFDPNDMEYMLRNAGTFPVRISVQALKYYREVLRKDLFQGTGGLLAAHGEDWFKFRTEVNPILMQPRIVQQYASKMDEVSKDLVQYIKHHTQKTGVNETPENFNDVLARWALESVAIVALNRRLGALDYESPENSEVNKFVKATLLLFDQFYKLEILPPYWKYLPSKTFSDFVKNLDYILSNVVKYIDEGLNENLNENVPEHEMSVLQRLAKRSKKIAFVTIADMLQAGVDTTGKTIGSILYFLAVNPDKQSILREEILKFLPNKDSPITSEILGKMIYLKAVIKETTRMAPIGLGNIRSTTKDMVIGGYRIPKNTNVGTVHFYTSYLTDKYFKQPGKFIPERWLRSTNDEYAFKNIHQYAFMPFGFGPRSCIGKRVASLELEMATVNVIRNFELSWNREKMRYGSKLLYGLLDPLQLSLQELN